MPAKSGPCKRQDRQRTPEQLRRRHGPRPWRAQRTRGGALDPGEAMKGYPLELRLKVLAAVDCGIPRKEVVRNFGIAMPTLERYMRLRRPTGDIHPPRPPDVGLTSPPPRSTSPCGDSLQRTTVRA